MDGSGWKRQKGTELGTSMKSVKKEVRRETGLRSLPVPNADAVPTRNWAHALTLSSPSCVLTGEGTVVMVSSANRPGLGLCVLEFRSLLHHTQPAPES